jgi:hypothetical protein
MQKSRWFDACWFLACLLASSAWCITAARQLSATFDEPLYVERGLESWRTGSHAGLMKLGTMPLPIDCCTLPLYVYERWTDRQIDPARDLDRVLPWARTAALAFWWLLLSYAWLAARSMAGPWGGRVAIAWIASEPNLLAHASLATTDIAVSACLLALVYHFTTGREGGWCRRVGLPGVWFGLAVLAKASALVFGPLCLLAVEAQRLWIRCHIKAEPQPLPVPAAVRSSFRDLVQIAVVGFVVTFVYCGCDWRTEPSFVAWAQTLPAGPGRNALVWLSEHLRVFSNAGEGLVRQVKHNMRGHHGSYLLGRVYPKPLWYYFPVALAIKLTLPVLIATSVLALRQCWRVALGQPSSAGRPNRRVGIAHQEFNGGQCPPYGSATNWALATALVLLAFSVSCRVQIGIRLVLPLVAFLVIGIAAAWTIAIQKAGERLRPIWIAGAAIAVLWTGAAAWRVWPEGLCYTNELWGGTPKGYLCLSDSNYDWGQGLKELAAWPTQRGLDQLDVWYFGTDPAVNVPPLRHLPLHLLPIAKPADLPLWVQGRYLAVSTTLAYGTTLDSPAQHIALEYLRLQHPVARTPTFLIYEVNQPVAQSSRSAQR